MWACSVITHLQWHGRTRAVHPLPLQLWDCCICFPFGNASGKHHGYYWWILQAKIMPWPKSRPGLLKMGNYFMLKKTCLIFQLHFPTSAGSVMERIQGPGKIGVACDILFAWGEIADGVTVQTSKTRQRYWKHWAGYCQQCNTDPFLTGISPCERAIIITAFAARVRTGAYGRGDQVKVQAVTDVIAAISKTCELVGQCSPVYKSEGTYILPVQRLVESFRRQDPPVIPQIAVPVEVPETARRLAYLTSNPRQHATGDLSMIAFYFLFRSGAKIGKKKWMNGSYHENSTVPCPRRAHLTQKLTTFIITPSGLYNIENNESEKGSHRSNALSRVNLPWWCSGSTCTTSTSYPQ